MILTITIISRLTLCIVCSALAMLMFFQLIRDRRSRIFGQFMLILALYGLLPVLTRTIHNVNTQLMFNGSVILIALIPLYTFYLVVEYLEKEWKPWQKFCLRFELFCISVPTILISITNRVHEYAYVTEDGLNIYKRYLHSQILLIVGELIFIPIAFLCLRRLLNPRADVDRRMVIGLLFFCLAAVTFMIPALIPLSLDGLLFAIGSILMTGVVLNQRLFNPMAELNQRLGVRAEQFATLTRVAQQTTSLLSLNTLLQTVVQEIRDAFQYDGISVFQKEVGQDVLVCTAVSGIGVLGRAYLINDTTPIGMAALGQQMVSIEDMATDVSAKALLDVPQLGSLTVVPLIIGSAAAGQSDIDAEQHTIGVLQIYRRIRYRLSDDNREVLTILARQMAIAIHNAELYGTAQEARRQADIASEAKTRFMSTMSHELRTPLQVVITMSEFCQYPESYGDDVFINEGFRKDLREITKSGKHLLGVINNILDWSKLDAGAVEIVTQPVDPIPVLEDAISQSTSLLNPNVTINRAFSPSLPYVASDELRLGQILLNLLSNACKFTDHGQISVGADRTDNKVIFWIKDTGFGIAKNAQSDLFTRFKQADSTGIRRRDGTGLGLAITKQLVELQGGTIWFESIEQVGSTFYFTLPIVNAPETLLAVEKVDISRVVIFPFPVPALPLQILIVDSVYEDWDHLTAEITRLGYRLVRATTSEDGAKLAQLLQPSIVLIVSYSTNDPAIETHLASFRSVINPYVTHLAFVSISDAKLRVNEIRAKVRELATLPFSSSS
ncbi:MAG: GAF domain-containing protein [Anaerolineae bacterium]|nr:GAF domain-containing protein [Anaerolineae bacterium]